MLWLLWKVSICGLLISPLGVSRKFHLLCQHSHRWFITVSKSGDNILYNLVVSKWKNFHAASFFASKIYRHISIIDKFAVNFFLFIFFGDIFNDNLNANNARSLQWLKTNKGKINPKYFLKKGKRAPLHFSTTFRAVGMDTIK